jgi:hypothetical protein
VITGEALRDRELQQRNIELAIAPTEGLTSASDMDVEMLFDDQQMGRWLS